MKIPQYFSDACEQVFVKDIGQEEFFDHAYRFGYRLAQWWIKQWNRRHTGLDANDLCQAGVLEMSRRLGIHGDDSRYVYDPMHPDAVPIGPWITRCASRAMQREIKRPIRFRTDADGQTSWKEEIPNLTVTRPSIGSDEYGHGSGAEPKVMEWLQSTVRHSSSGRAGIRDDFEERMAATLGTVGNTSEYTALETVTRRLVDGATLDGCLIECESNPRAFGGLDSDELDRLTRYATTSRFWAVRRKRAGNPINRIAGPDMIQYMSVTQQPESISTALALIPSHDPHADVRLIVCANTAASLESLVGTRYNQTVDAGLALARVLFWTKFIFDYVKEVREKSGDCTGDLGPVLKETDCPVALYELVSELAVKYQSYNKFIKAAALVNDEIGRTTGFELPRAYGVCLEIAEDRGIPIEEIWQQVGSTKLTVVAQVSPEDRAEFAEAALQGTTVAELKRKQKEREAELKSMVDAELGAEQAATDESDLADIISEEARITPDIEPDTGNTPIEFGPDDNPDTDELVSVVIKETAGKPIQIRARDIEGEHDSLDGADTKTMGERVFYTYRAKNGTAITLKPDNRDGKIRGAVIQFDSVGRK